MSVDASSWKETEPLIGNGYLARGTAYIEYTVC